MAVVHIYIPAAAEREMIKTLGDGTNMRVWCKSRLLDAIREKFGETCLFDSRRAKRAK